MLAGTATAMASVAVKGIVECVAKGMTRRDATEISAQILAGMADLITEGVGFSEMIESTASTRGYATQSMWDLEKQGFGLAYAEATAKAIKQLEDEEADG